MGNVENTPFASLGNALRAIRLRFKESLLEASEAIEVSGERLALFENGELRPSEDVLELLISHFSIGEKEADKLWQLAGYSKKNDQDMSEATTQPGQNVFVMPFDVRVVYTDMVHVSINNFGVVMNFMQTTGQQNQPMAIARVGMSREHAKSVLDVLQKTLEQSEPDEPKQLQSPSDGAKNE